MEQRRDIENIKPACRLILASASPRRRELLERIGLKPEIHPSTLEENPLCTEPAQVVMELAGQKARDVMAQVREEARTTGILFSGIIIGSDTVVSVDDEILGKPADRDEALEMIGRIQGRSHRVYTGVAILTEDRESCFAVETRVDVYPMSDAEIEAYVDCGESMDKAGPSDTIRIRSRRSVVFPHLGGAIRSVFRILPVPGSVKIDRIFAAHPII